MRTRNILFALLVMAALSSCEHSAVRRGRSLYEAYFDKYLKDPSSFKVYKETYKRDGLRVEWELDYGAKNGFGAMGRKTIKFETSPDMLFMEDGVYPARELK